MDSQMPLLRAKATTEEELRNSSMSWTILQPDVFMDRLVPLVVGVPVLEDRPVTLVGEGRRRHSFVAMRDVAAYAVAAATRHDSEARTLAVGGPEPVSWRDIVHAFSDELGKEVPVHTVDLGEPIPTPARVRDLASRCAGDVRLAVGHDGARKNVRNNTDQPCCIRP